LQRAEAMEEMQLEAERNSQEKAAQEKQAETVGLDMHQKIMKHAQEKAALQLLAGNAMARALAMQEEAGKHAQERSIQQQRAEAAEARE
jgi:hypothetical protein